MIGCEHDSALQRLEGAEAEQGRSSQRYVRAIGTSTEVRAYDELCAAGEQVGARTAWLHWVDDKRYRGINAGPFSLRAEISARGHASDVRFQDLPPEMGRRELPRCEDSGPDPEPLGTDRFEVLLAPAYQLSGAQPRSSAR